jgi:hypothetical protein
MTRKFVGRMPGLCFYLVPSERREMSPTKRCTNYSDGYRTWLNALPQNLEASATAEALRAICDLDLSDIESAEPPRGLV